MKSQDVTVIGLGALGTALVRTLHERGFNVKSIFNRSSEKAKTLAEELNISSSGTFPSKFDDLGNLIFLTVTDSSINDVALKLNTLSDDFSNKTVIHCSGNESSELLNCLSGNGASTAAFHPLQSFTQSSRPTDFRDIYFSIEGDKKAKTILKKICNRLSSKWLEVSVKEKSYLHAAAVMASNYLVALTGASIDIGKSGNLKEEDLRQALLPLMQTTLENVKSTTPSEALSGPIARGDVQTVAKHLELLKTDRELLSLYKMLGRQTLKVAEEKGSLDTSEVDLLRSLLNV